MWSRNVAHVVSVASGVEVDIAKTTAANPVVSIVRNRSTTPMPNNDAASLTKRLSEILK